MKSLSRSAVQGGKGGDVFTVFCTMSTSLLLTAKLLKIEVCRICLGGRKGSLQKGLGYEKFDAYIIYQLCKKPRSFFLIPTV